VPFRAAACALVVLLLGGNAAMVQAVAWVGMLADRAARMEWSQAVETTFSGKERCSMCHVATALRDQDEPGVPTPESKQLVKQPSAPPDAHGDILVPCVSGLRLTVPSPPRRPGEFRPAPLVPPPRAA